LYELNPGQTVKTTQPKRQNQGAAIACVVS